jgi:hypothetical protein
MNYRPGLRRSHLFLTAAMWETSAQWKVTAPRKVASRHRSAAMNRRAPSIPLPALVTTGVTYDDPFRQERRLQHKRGAYVAKIRLRQTESGRRSFDQRDDLIRFRAWLDTKMPIRLSVSAPQKATGWFMDAKIVPRSTPNRMQLVFLPQRKLLSYRNLDETVDGHCGKNVYGKARYRDGVRSSHSHAVHRYGHKWIVLAILVTLPYTTRPFALRVLVALYRDRKTNAAEGVKQRCCGGLPACSCCTRSLCCSTIPCPGPTRTFV